MSVGKGRTQGKQGDLMLHHSGLACSVTEFGVLRSKSRDTSCGSVLVRELPQASGALSPLLPAACWDPRLLKL